MDTIPAQDTSQQVPVAPVATFASSFTQKLPQKKSFRKVFNISSWIILFALAPLTVLIFLSQDSIPGDFFYPVKRSLENVVLAAASVSPATRAAFSTDLTAARFKEAQSLVVSKSNTSGLATFIDDVQSAKQEVANLEDDTQRTKAEEKLINKVEEYQAGLSALEVKTEQNIIAYQSSGTPTATLPPTGGLQTSTSTPTPTLIPSSTPTSQPPPTLTPTPTLTPVPTSVPSISSSPTSTPIPTSAPALTLVPTVAKTSPTVPPQQENAQITEQKKIVQTIKETKTSLEKIKKDLEEKHEKRSENQRKDKEK